MVSTLSGPIPPHPYYDQGDQAAYVEKPAPRVKREAEDYATHGTKGTLGLLLVQGSRPMSFMPKPKKQGSKDHLKENVRRMRRIQRESKRKDVEAEVHQPVPVKALWKSNKYEGVQSRVMEDLDREPPTPRPWSSNYLRSHSRTGWATPPSRPGSAASECSLEPPEEKLSVPKAASARDVKLKRHDIDFIKVNGRAACKSSMKRSPSLTALDDIKKKTEDETNNYKRGEVPTYLQSRQKEWVQEAADRKASVPDPEMPPGHKLMPHQERIETLNKLKQKETELLSQLHSMPIRTDTVRVRTRKEELERKLAELEEAIKIFLRPKVFVKMET